jgi:hypothetical protein
MGADHTVGAAVLKTLVLALVVANLGFYAWSRGWIGGGAGHGDREPERLARQVRPESIRILPPGSIEAPRSRSTPSAPAATPAPSAPAASAATVSAAPAGDSLACLQSGPFTPAEVPQVEAALHAVLPSQPWTQVKVETPGIWLIYMGKFASRDVLRQKLEELGRLRGLTVEEVRNAPELEPGLALGRFDSRASADAALARLAERGVRTARVVALSPPIAVVTLRFERLDATLRTQLLGLPPAVVAHTGFAPCAPLVASASAPAS